MVDSSESQSLLHILDRFEKQTESCNKRAALVELFCAQIIPFLQTQPSLDPLRMKWHKKYLGLFHQLESSQKEALNEVKKTFSRLIKVLKKKKASIADKIARIQVILSGDPRGGFSSWPFHKIVYFELKELLQMVLDSGEIKICRQYANLGKTKKSIAQPDGSSKVIEIPFVQAYTFAPSVEKAVQAEDAMDWKRLNNSAVVWVYFEKALWFWNTSESYFERSAELLKNPQVNFLLAFSQKSACLEIIRVKKSSKPDREPLIFTNQLFKEGLKTLINEIRAFASTGFQLKEKLNDPIEKVVFELRLEENRLWIFAYVDSLTPKKYYLKRFNDGGVNGSAPYEFIQELVNDHPQGSNLGIELIYKSESIPKIIDRIGMPGVLKTLFFGPSRGNSVIFHGVRVAVERDERCRLILNQLESLQRTEVGSLE